MAEGFEEEPLPAVVGSRFLTLKDVQAELQISEPQAMALIRRGELRAIQVGGRGLWRIERAMLEEFIAEAYRRAAERTDSGGGDEDDA
jgi:excisionase family DNA binding protein